MNDRFKFRVWNTETNEYLVGCFLVGGGNMIHDSVDYESFLNKGNYIIEQCTGLKDKNGNLIYEGDIVCDRGEIERVCDLPLVVEWSDRLCRFMFDNEKIGMRFNLTSIDGAESHNYEIIGNIHESNKLWIHYEQEQKE